MSGQWGVRVAVGLGVSVVAVVLLLRTVDVSATAVRLASMDLAWLLLPLLAIAGQFALRALRWSVLLRATTGAAVQPASVVGPLAVGYLVNAVLPARLGEVARAVLVARREHLMITPVAASIVVERVIDLAALLSIGIVATGAISVIGWSAILGTAALAASLLVLAMSAQWLEAHIPRAVPTRIRVVASQFLLGIAGCKPRVVIATYGLSAIAWMGDVAVVLLCGEAIGADLSLPAAVAIAVGAALGTALPAASGYLGTYELGAVAIGSIVGTAPETILAIALVTHFFAVVPMAIMGLIATVRMGVHLRFGAGSPMAIADER